MIVVRDLSERKELKWQVIHATDQEQERIGREIHDGIGQDLTGLTMLAASLVQRLEQSDDPSSTQLARTVFEHLQALTEELRGLARGPARLPGKGVGEVRWAGITTAGSSNSHSGWERLLGVALTPLYLVLEHWRHIRGRVDQLAERLPLPNRSI